MSEAERVRRSYEARIDDVRPGERSVVAVVSTAAVDRLKTVLVPRGIRLGQYRRSPVVLWEHGEDPVRGTVPVGKNQWIKAQGDTLVAKTIFAGDQFSRDLFQLYQEEVLRGFSIHIAADRGTMGPPTAEEKRARPELEACKTVYRSGELLEYSATAIPANAECLALAVSRGLWLPDALLATVAQGIAGPAPGPPPEPAIPPATPELPPLVGRSLAEVEAAVRRRVRAEAERDRDRLIRDVTELARGMV